MAISRLLSRPMLASMFVMGGVDSLRNASAMAPVAAGVTSRMTPALEGVLPAGLVPRDPVVWVRLNGMTQIVAGGALATGTFPRIAATVLAASLVPTTVAAHRFWEATDEEERTQQRIQFFKNVSMLGGLLVAAGDTEGRPGLLWRTRRAAHDVGREARHAAKDVRREARLARAQLT